jgi:cobalt/nickel transport protein
VVALAAPAWAHFGMIVPKAPVADMDQKSITLEFSFSHPFGGEGMNLVRPKAAGVAFEGQITDLRAALAPAKIMDHDAFPLDYAFKRPGVYTFFMEPQPYWEPAEDVSIIHYTKVSVAAFGGDEGWDEPVGLKTEIVPMLRPFGNWAGNTFVGQVLLDGKPVPGAEVEVELYNQGRFTMPTEYNETQVIKADAQGVFRLHLSAARLVGLRGPVRGRLHPARRQRPRQGQGQGRGAGRRILDLHGALEVTRRAAARGPARSDPGGPLSFGGARNAREGTANDAPGRGGLYRSGAAGAVLVVGRQQRARVSSFARRSARVRAASSRPSRTSRASSTCPARPSSAATAPPRKAPAPASRCARAGSPRARVATSPKNAP